MNAYVRGLTYSVYVYYTYVCVVSSIHIVLFIAGVVN